MQVQGRSKLYTGVWQVLALLSVMLAGLHLLFEPVMFLSSVVSVRESSRSFNTAHVAVLLAVPDHDELSLQGCKHMYSKEGIKGMFQGNGTNCVRIVPNSAVKFLAYEQISRYSMHGLGHTCAGHALQHAGYSIAALHTMTLSCLLNTLLTQLAPCIADNLISASASGATVVISPDCLMFNDLLEQHNTVDTYQQHSLSRYI